MFSKKTGQNGFTHLDRDLHYTTLCKHPLRHLRTRKSCISSALRTSDKQQQRWILALFWRQTSKKRSGRTNPRAQLGLDKETPMTRPVSNRASPSTKLVALPRVGGLEFQDGHSPLGSILRTLSRGKFGHACILDFEFFLKQGDFVLTLSSSPARRIRSMLLLMAKLLE